MVKKIVKKSVKNHCKIDENIGEKNVEKIDDKIDEKVYWHKSTTVHQKDKDFVLNPLHGGLQGGRQSPFFGPKISIFYATPI